MISFVDEKQNFIFFHVDSFSILWNVIEVKRDLNEYLISTHFVTDTYASTTGRMKTRPLLVNNLTFHGL